LYCIKCRKYNGTGSIKLIWNFRIHTSNNSICMSAEIVLVTFVVPKNVRVHVRENVIFSQYKLTLRAYICIIFACDCTT